MDSKKVNSFGGMQPARRDSRFFGGKSDAKVEAEKPIMPVGEPVIEEVEKPIDVTPVVEPIEPVAEPVASVDSVVESIAEPAPIETQVSEVAPVEMPVEEATEPASAPVETPAPAETPAATVAETSVETPMPAPAPVAEAVAEEPVEIEAPLKDATVSIPPASSNLVFTGTPKSEERVTPTTVEKKSNKKMSIGILIGVILLIGCVVGMVFLLNGINGASNKIDSLSKPGINIDKSEEDEDKNEDADSEDEDDDEKSDEDKKDDSDKKEDDSKKDEEDKIKTDPELSGARNESRVVMIEKIAKKSSDYWLRYQGKTPFSENKLGRFTQEFVDSKCKYEKESDTKYAECGEGFTDPDGSAMSWAVPGIASVSDTDTALTTVNSSRVNHRIYSVQSAKCGTKPGTYTYVGDDLYVALFYVGEDDVVICKDNQ